MLSHIAGTTTVSPRYDAAVMRGNTAYTWLTADSSARSANLNPLEFLLRAINPLALCGCLLMALLSLLSIQG